ncbi:MAG: hypothetical protein Kow0059_01280 [Candidatus Sumerlaeia bacterium]
MKWHRVMRRVALTVLAGGVVLGWSAGVQAQDEFIVESNPAGKNADRYHEAAGQWQDSEAKAQLPGLTPGIGSRFLDIKGGSMPGRAVWTLTAPETGTWDVQVAWGRSGNAGPVTYIVETGDSVTSKALVQAGWGGEISPNADQWHSLGMVDCAAGAQVRVTLDVASVDHNPDPRNNWRVYADAVRLVKPGSPAAQPASSASASAARPPAVAEPSGARLGASPFITSQPGEGSAPFVTKPVSPETGTSAAQPAQVSAVSGQTPTASTAPAAGATASGTASQPSPFTTTVIGMAGTTWIEDYRQAIAEGLQQGKPILLYFYVPGQEQSQQLEATVLSDPAVAAELGRFVLCRIRLGDNPRLDAHYKADRAPLIYFLNRSGISQARTTGLITPASMVQALRQYQ